MRYGSIDYRLWNKESKPGIEKLPIIATDLDHTLVKPKGRRKFARNGDDWQWIPGVKEKLLAFLKSYRIIIITNQKSTPKKKLLNANIARQRIDKMESDLGINEVLEAVVLTGNDVFRKPSPFIWSFLRKYTEQKPEDIIYIGDAAGRTGDFSDSDLKLSLNLKMKFSTPEVAYQDQKPTPLPAPIKPEDMVKKLTKGFTPEQIATTYSPTIIGGKRFVIIMVGYPGSGKSTFSRKLASAIDGEKVLVFTRDQFTTKKKYLAEINNAMLQGKSVIIDMMNPSNENRQPWIDLATTYKASSLILEMNTTKELSLHMNRVRQKMAFTESIKKGLSLEESLKFSNKELKPEFPYRMFERTYQSPVNSFDVAFNPPDQKTQPLMYAYFTQFT